MKKIRPVLSACILFVTIALPTFSFAQDPNEKDTARRRDPLDRRHLKRLFKDLGALEYQTREQASVALLRMGRPVIPALEELFQESRDPEIKSRASFIAGKIYRDHMKKNGPGYLGVMIDRTRGEIPGRPNSGVAIKTVQPGLPAIKAGIKDKDVIYQVGGHRVQNYEELRSAIISRAAGDMVEVIVFRGAKKLRFQITLAKAPPPASIAPPIPGQKGRIVPMIPAPIVPGAPNNQAIIQAIKAQLAILKKTKQPNQNQIQALEKVLKQLLAGEKKPPARVIKPKVKIQVAPRIPIRPDPKDKEKSPKKN
jgi:hypothetical protein